MHVLIVEDDPRLGRALTEQLTGRGLAVDAAASLDEARNALELGSFDALVLDRTLPDGDGMDLCRELRADGRTVPVLVLTARDDLPSLLEGFAGGADDYLGKPFSAAELDARLSALLRRGRTLGPPVLRVGPLEIDRARRRVARDGVRIPLTAKEFALLEVLADPPGRLVDRFELLERCWDYADTPGSNVIDVHVRSLRRKLGEDAIETQRGAGYRLSG